MSGPIVWGSKKSGERIDGPLSRPTVLPNGARKQRNFRVHLQSVQKYPKIQNMVPPWLILVLVLAMPGGCTWNPFDHSKIQSDNLARTITGNVTLSDGRNPAGVYVWLEGANVGTFTDSAGAFTLTLPGGAELGGISGLSGVYRLCFYIANFKLVTVKVALRDGQFIYGEQSLDQNGHLRQTVSLVQILRISTIVYPASVPYTYKQRIWIKTTVQSLIDTVKVIFPRSDGTFLGGVFLKNLKTGALTILQAPYGPDVRYEVDVGQEPVSLVRIFTLGSYPLPPGQYKVIPYLFVQQKNLPQELLESLGEQVTSLSTEYLKIPFIRKDGLLQVTGL